MSGSGCEYPLTLVFSCNYYFLIPAAKLYSSFSVKEEMDHVLKMNQIKT